MPVLKRIGSRLEKLREILANPVPGRFSVILIGIVAIALPAYGLSAVKWKDVQFNLFTILIPVLYVLAVAGFVFFALGRTGRDIEAARDILAARHAINAMHQHC